MPLRHVLRLGLLLVLLSACAYPRRTTHVVPLPDSAVSRKERPEGMWQVEVLGAELPPRKKTGLPWDDDGTGPDPYLRLYVGERLVWESEVREDTNQPQWNTTLPRNVMFPADASFRIEVWDRDSAVASDPIGSISRDRLPATMLPDAKARLTLNSLGVVILRLTDPKPHSGVGLEVEVHSDELKILSVSPYSPASRAGLRKGDAIVGFGTERVANLSNEEAFGRLSLAVDRGTKLWVRKLGVSEERIVTLDKGPLWFVM